MKEHFCPAEKSIITYQGKCNWCGEKEALAQTQEPVQFKCTVIDNQHPNGIPLEQWAKPPQRTWVGLTDEDRLRLWLKTESEDVDRYAFAKAIEAKLKQKNGYAEEKNT